MFLKKNFLRPWDRFFQDHRASVGPPRLRRKEGPEVEQERPVRHPEGVPAQGLVQVGAARPEDQGGGLPHPHHHKPLLLRPVQLLLHPEEPEAKVQAEGGAGGERGRGPERAGVQVVRLLQTDEVHVDHGDPAVPVAAAPVQEEEGAEDQAVQVRGGQSELRGNVVYRGFSDDVCALCLAVT